MKKKDLFKNIVSIRTKKNNVITFGTGFFIIAEDGEIYLVTASHVARDTLRSSDIWIQNLDTELPLAIKLGALSKNAIWIHHDRRTKNKPFWTFSISFEEAKQYRRKFLNALTRESQWEEIIVDIYL